MFFFMVGIGLATFTLWLLKLYVYGGWSKVAGRNRHQSLDALFPKRSKEIEEELERRRKLFDERKANCDSTNPASSGVGGGGDGNGNDTKDPPKNFFDEVEEFIAKRKLEKEERKRAAAAAAAAAGAPGRKRTGTNTKFNKRKGAKAFDWLNNAE